MCVSICEWRVMMKENKNLDINVGTKNSGGSDSKTDTAETMSSKIVSHIEDKPHMGMVDKDHTDKLMSYFDNIIAKIGRASCRERVS